ncbi:type II toxin-antitoxin system VapC family toxin [Anaerolineae bacterium CFX7]|nr:type II toxin-antitoxin system VapC family toxin [Anaerolineae bacterium CFX7]
MHLAIATVSEMDFLLTWNHKHLANATLRKRVAEIVQREGYKKVVICTPSELLTHVTQW